MRKRINLIGSPDWAIEIDSADTFRNYTGSENSILQPDTAWILKVKHILICGRRSADCSRPGNVIGHP